ncbi:hypothetical protein [Paracoccus sp. (in: a-proteobacteria)]|uniref:hypothetical protein n=1 Tax=Paracoccus sp. TaxID=267 RepID=UPI00289B1DB5|nr:hypothetical protein [Paracoccus sp. (in: a-proteobacteria)]
MKLTDLLSEEARSTGRDLRLQRYLDEACTFLEFAYEDDQFLQKDSQRREFAQACYERSHNLGITLIRDHLGYLSLSVLCGYAFEANPLLQTELDRAGWIDERWQTRRSPDPVALTEFANRWQQMARLECANPVVLLSACQDALDQIEGEPHGQALPRALHLNLLRNAWPDRSAIMPERTLEWFCDLLNRNIVQQNMPADVAIVFSVLSLHLGIFFFHDPRYQELAIAHAQGSEDPAARSARVAAAMLHFLTLSPVSEGGTAHG